MNADISLITDRLFLASHMRDVHAQDIQSLHINLIISMIGQHKPSEKLEGKGCRVLWLKAYDTFLTPVSMRKLRKGVSEALEVLNSGGRVLVFCHQGRRRSVTMMAAILIALGYSADEAVALIESKRNVVLPVLWYVRWRIRKFEKYWRIKNNES